MKWLCMLCLILPSWSQTAKGTLEIKSQPGGAEIIINGQKKGITPDDPTEKLIVRLPEGDYAIEAKKDGVGTASRAIFVGEDVVQPLTLVLKPAIIVNSLGMKFASVPIVGGRTDGKDLRFSIWETRYMDFKAFVADSGYDPLEHAEKGTIDEDQPGNWKTYAWQATNSHPVVNVSWEDAQAFCAWLTKKEHAAGLLRANQRYRLPTDHEWSCAAGIADQEDPNKTPFEKSNVAEGYAWGKKPKAPNNSENFSPDLEVDSVDFTAAVGTFSTNLHGLYDIGGNVSELCEDLYSAEETWRTLRGASWFEDSPENLRSSHRSAENPKGRLPQIGFRCVLVTDDVATSSASITKNDPPRKQESQKVRENSLGMRFVPVPIRGGATDGQTVWFSIWETRYIDFKAFIDDSGYDATTNPNSGSKDQETWEFFPWKATYGHPVVNLNSRDIAAFCEWLTKKERKAGNITDKQVYRLPRDQEWSCAACSSATEKPSGMPKFFYTSQGGLIKEAKSSAKDLVLGAGQEESYPWGAAWPPPENTGNFGSALEADDFENTAPVGSFTPNHYGIYDLAGNVSESIEGDYVQVPYKTFGILRGSSWISDDNQRQLYTSTRIGNNSMLRQSYVGFRCVLATP